MTEYIERENGERTEQGDVQGCNEAEGFATNDLLFSPGVLHMLNRLRDLANTISGTPIRIPEGQSTYYPE